jgi:hypothetical protein
VIATDSGIAPPGSGSIKIEAAEWQPGTVHRTDRHNCCTMAVVYTPAVEARG